MFSFCKFFDWSSPPVTPYNKWSISENNKNIGSIVPTFKQLSDSVTNHRRINDFYKLYSISKVHLILLSLIYPIFFFQIKPMLLDCFIITLSRILAILVFETRYGLENLLYFRDQVTYSQHIHEMTQQTWNLSGWIKNSSDRSCPSRSAGKATNTFSAKKVLLKEGKCYNGNKNRNFINYFKLKILKKKSGIGGRNQREKLKVRIDCWIMVNLIRLAMWFKEKFKVLWMN